MAEASISVDLDRFSCSVCLDLLKDPVTINCGHSFCLVCIDGCWDQEDQKKIYSCPQCRETFTPRPELRRNSMLAVVVEKRKKKLQAASPAHCYAGPEDVECDSCPERKLKTIKCTMDEHRGHNTVAAVAERKEKENQLKDMQKKTEQIIQMKEKKLQEVKELVESIRSCAQSAVEDSERIFTELISFIEKKSSEVTKLIRDQEKAKLSLSEELLKKLEQEITDLKRRNTELEQLLHTEDHIHFLQSLKSFCVSSDSDDSTSFTDHQHLSFDEVRKSLSDVKKQLKEFCKEEINKISPHAAAAVEIISPSEPKTREDFLQYFCQLTLNPNTVNNYLSLSENNRVVMFSVIDQYYSDHPERFDSWRQVLCNERLSGRCYWEVEWWSSVVCVYISVSYKTISRKGEGKECWFGHNNQSWSLQCSHSSSPSLSLSFWHNNIETKISAPSSSRIGVYVDHSAGTLSFYSVSDTMTLLHTVHTTFTQPLYAGFWFNFLGTVKLCNPK